MKSFRLFLVGLFAALLPALMAPTGGFPSRPSFQSLKIFSNGSPVSVFPTIICVTACNAANMSVGQTVIVDVSPTGTIRSSNATPTIDPILQISNIPVGYYTFDTAFTVASGAGGFTGGFLTTACTSTNIAITGVQIKSAGFTVAGVSDEIGGLTYIGTAGQTQRAASINSFLQVSTAPASVGLCWSQTSSNAATTVLQGGFLRITRIS